MHLLMYLLLHALTCMVNISSQQIKSQAKETYESIKQQMDQTLTQALETINTTSNQTAAKIKDTNSTTDTAPQGIYSK